MDTLPLQLLVIGVGTLVIILGILPVLYFIRRRYMTKTTTPTSLPIYEPTTNKGFIPLNNISSTDQTCITNTDLSFNPDDPQPYDFNPGATDTTFNVESPSHSFWQGGEGYYVTPPSEKSQLQPPFHIHQDPTQPPQALVSPREPSDPSTPATLVGNEKDVVYLDGLLESKKWKLKDFRVDNETYHRPQKSNIWRTSYSVW